MPFRSWPLRLLFLTLLIVLPGTGCLPRPLEPQVITGKLHGEQTWDGNVLIAGDVTLAADARLTILPGTKVRFLRPEGVAGGESDHPHFPGSELNVHGSLTAVGTAEAPISFAAADERVLPGAWGAVNFAEGSRGIFRYCTFRQADSAIHSREATVEVTESLFENNFVGVRFHTSDIRIEHNLLRGNGVGIRFHFGAPVVRNNRFENNRVNLFITAHPRDYLFENNLFGIPSDYQVVLGEDVPEDVQLANNDWGGEMAVEAGARMFDGRRTPYLGKVRVEPVMTVSPDRAGSAWIR